VWIAHQHYPILTPTLPLKGREKCFDARSIY
jgi:hypothetical protein